MPCACLGKLLQVPSSVCVCVCHCQEHCAALCFVDRSLPGGTAPFAQFGAARALGDLRQVLQTLEVENALAYGTHAMRRGHAQDLLQSGAGLVQILRAGEWRSAAFKEYLHAEQLEAGAVMEAHYAGSGDEQE